MFSEIRHLLHKEFLLEMRQKSALGGILLYVVSTIFVAYLSFKKLVDIPTWNALFWIIVLFAAFNAVSHSFSKDSRGQQLFDYLLVSPQGMILSKIIFNTVLMLVILTLSILFYTLFLGTNLLGQADPLMFATALFLGGTGFASTLTMVAAIASKTNNSIGLMAILGFPVILPMLITLIRFSKNAIDGLAWSVSYEDALVLFFLNVIVVVLSLLLFPYLWRE